LAIAATVVALQSLATLSHRSSGFVVCPGRALDSLQAPARSRWEGLSDASGRRSRRRTLVVMGGEGSVETATRSTTRTTRRPSTRGLPLDLRGIDITKRPVQLLHPSKVQKGRPRARWQDTFRVWRREIPKPDFNILHAAKAVRLLPKLTFANMPADQPVFLNLMNQTKRLLKQGEAGGQEVGAMIRACAALRTDLPQLQAELLPLLVPLVPETISDMTAMDLTNLVLASAELREDDLPDLWEVMPSQLGVIADGAGEIEIKDIPALLALIRKMPDEEGKATRAMEALQHQAVEKLPDFSLPQLASLIWGLEDDIERRLLTAVSSRVANRTATWNYKEVHPDLWRLVCAYGKLGVHEAPVLKAVARRALREGLDGLSGWGLAALVWAYSKLENASDGLADFRRHLDREVELREMSEELISQSYLGPDGGGNATLRRLWAAHPSRRAGRQMLLAPPPPLFKALRP